jgi:hypothetical protein
VSLRHDGGNCVYYQLENSLGGQSVCAPREFSASKCEPGTVPQKTSVTAYTESIEGARYDITPTGDLLLTRQDVSYPCELAEKAFTFGNNSYATREGMVAPLSGESCTRFGESVLGLGWLTCGSVAPVVYTKTQLWVPLVVCEYTVP